MKLKKFGTTELAIYNDVKPIADNLGFSIWDVCFEKEGACWYLRIFIDHEDGIDIEDCERMTRPVNELLDAKDPIPQNYILEVGSAGLERELNQDWHFKASIGMLIRVRAIRPINGEKEWIGTLVDFDNSKLTIEQDGNTIELPLEELAFVKRYEEFSF